jgi:hypothetical protein
MMSTNAGFKLAPPTRKPSISGCFANSLQFFSVTLPPYRMRVFSAASLETAFCIHSRIALWTSCACSVVATLPVPMALRYVSHTFVAWYTERMNWDAPNGLIRHNDFGPVLDDIRHSLELRSDNLNRLVRLALLEALAAAQNHADAGVQRGLGLGRNELVVLFEDDAALRVAQDRPCDASVLELVRGDFAGEGAAGLVVDVLRGDFEAIAEVLARQGQVDGWGCDDDLCVGC